MKKTTSSSQTWTKIYGNPRFHRYVRLYPSLRSVTSKELRFTSQNTISIVDIYFIYGNKVTTYFGLYHQAIIRSEVNNRI
jgi:hypothetical protein